MDICTKFVQIPQKPFSATKESLVLLNHVYTIVMDWSFITEKKAFGSRKDAQGRRRDVEEENEGR